MNNSTNGTRIQSGTRISAPAGLLGYAQNPPAAQPQAQPAQVAQPQAPSAQPAQVVQAQPQAAPQPTPAAQPAQVNPQPAVANQPQQPAPAPTNQFPDDAPRHSKLAIFIIVALALVFVAAIVFLIYKFAMPKDGDQDPGTSQPGTVQTGSGDQSSTPAPTQGDDGNNGDGDGANSNLSQAEQAALLDTWYADIPESAWLSMTAEELGGSTTVPLGDFCKDFCVVLADGTVIARATTEDGTTAPVILTDYQVPEEWRGVNGKVIALDGQKTELVLLVTKIDDSDSPLAGAIWQWDIAEGGYTYLGNGSSTRYE